jgi:threonylcarbamoyladenosine tRNA methylthiotransferase MtaB
MRYYIFTTGCKANQWDSHVIAGLLKQSGMTGGLLHNSDIIIINACSLTGRAETDARRFIQRARQINSEARIALVGCHPQVYKERNFGVDLVLGQEEKFDPFRYLSGVRGSFVAQKRNFVMESAATDGLQKNRTRFFFKIQDGCNKFCSYCVVPYARGSVRSRPVDEILEMMGSLREKGVKEVVLTGIDISSYSDPATGATFKDLLTLLETARTPPRLRISSIDPEYLDDSFITFLASSTKVAPSVHMPVQSGSDTILKLMGRRHTAAFIRERVGRLLEALPDAGVGMDIMVGFPGEDDGAFEETFQFLQSIDLSYLHIFPFSEREGTRACGLDHKVGESVKKMRVKKLKALDAEKRHIFSRRFIGRQVWVIPEGKVHRGMYMKGFAENYLPVYLSYEKTLENNLLHVTIKGIEDGRLIGG